VRLLQNQLRTSTKLQVLEPDRRHCRMRWRWSAPGSRRERDASTRRARSRYALEADRVLEDADFWRRLGEEYQTPLIVTGRIGFGEAEPVRLSRRVSAW